MGVDAAGEAPEGPRPSVEPVELEGGELPASPSSSDPDELDEPEEPAEPVMPRDRLMAAFQRLADYLGLIDTDSVGPQMFGEDMEQLFEHAELFEQFVRKLGKARFTVMTRTP
jgi:hypothetical protein